MNSQVNSAKRINRIKEGFHETATQQDTPSPRLESSFGLSCEVITRPPGELPQEIVIDNHTIGINLGANHEIEQIIDGVQVNMVVTTGMVGIFPFKLPLWSRWNRDIKHLYLHLEPEFLSRLALELFNDDTVSLITDPTVHDSLVVQLGLALKAELGQVGNVSQIYADSAATLLGTHLLKHYSNRRLPKKLPDGGLSPAQLKLTIDYIQAHLSQKVCIDELANHLNLSRYYFCRLFKQSTGLSPYKYVTRCRVERAQYLLRGGKLGLAEVAIACGFSHQSHLNRHFKQWTGITPKEFINL